VHLTRSLTKTQSAATISVSHTDTENSIWLPLQTQSRVVSEQGVLLRSSIQTQNHRAHRGAALPNRSILWLALNDAAQERAQSPAPRMALTGAIAECDRQRSDRAA